LAPCQFQRSPCAWVSPWWGSTSQSQHHASTIRPIFSSKQVVCFFWSSPNCQSLAPQLEYSKESQWVSGDPMTHAHISHTSSYHIAGWIWRTWPQDHHKWSFARLKKTL
jgi:hypothetical protein